MQEEISFGLWLRKQRRALDLTRQAFADQVGCAEVTLRQIEAETLKPSKELASIFLENLGIPQTESPQRISFARGVRLDRVAIVPPEKHFQPITRGCHAERSEASRRPEWRFFVAKSAPQNDIS